MKTMYIGAIARKSGLSPRTIRYYETIGVLPRAARTGSGYRFYTDEAVSRLEFIHKAKSLGLTLKEIRQILVLHDRGVVPCEHTKEFIRHKLNEIDEKIAALRALKATLSEVLKVRFLKHSPAVYCPIIEGTGKKPLTLHPAGKLIM